MKFNRGSQSCQKINLCETLHSRYLRGRVFFTSLIGFFLFHLCAAQKSDSAKASSVKPSLQVSDSVKAARHNGHSPGKAVLFSAILPGLGQAYNHKYWKIPIVYAALGTMAYFIVHNQQQYNTFNTAVKTRYNNGIDPFINVYSPTELTTLRDSYHRYRDLSFIGGIIVYALNIVDAEVDAQFFTFNVSDDISARFAPSLITNPTCGNLNIEPGLSFVMRLK